MFTDREVDILIEEIREENNELLEQLIEDRAGSRNGDNRGSGIGRNAVPVPQNEELLQNETEG